MASPPTGSGIDGMFLATLLLLGIAMVPLAQLRTQEHMLDGSMPGASPEASA